MKEQSDYLYSLYLRLYIVKLTQPFVLNDFITNDHEWPLDKLLEFSYLPGINNALEGDTRIEVYRHHEDEDVVSSDPDEPG